MPPVKPRKRLLFAESKAGVPPEKVGVTPVTEVSVPGGCVKLESDSPPGGM